MILVGIKYCEVSVIKRETKDVNSNQTNRRSSENQ